MKAEPQKEHQWLQKMLGEWTSVVEAVMQPGEPTSNFKGTETVRSLGDLWVVGEGRGDMPGGGTAQTMLTLGFDPQRKRFVGTWVGSMMTHLWVYDGRLDEAGNVLTLDTEGPSFSPEGGMAKYQEVITFHSDDHRTMTSSQLRDDGTLHQFMTAHYRRKR